MVPAHGAGIELCAVLLEQRGEFVKACTGRAARRHDIQVCTADTGLDRIEIQVLQHLGLQQFTDPGDFRTPRAIVVGIRQETVC